MNESDRPRNPPHLMNAFGEFCVLNGSQRIATGLRSRDDKVVGKDGVGSVTTRSLSLRGESASEGRDNPSCLGEGGRVMWFACWRTVDRHGLSALAITRCLKRESRLRNYAAGSACWHGPFGLPPLWSRPAALRLFIH